MKSHTYIYKVQALELLGMCYPKLPGLQLSPVLRPDLKARNPEGMGAFAISPSLNPAAEQ